MGRHGLLVAEGGRQMGPGGAEDRCGQGESPPRTRRRSLQGCCNVSSSPQPMWMATRSCAAHQERMKGRVQHCDWHGPLRRHILPQHGGWISEGMRTSLPTTPFNNKFWVECHNPCGRRNGEAHNPTHDAPRWWDAVMAQAGPMWGSSVKRCCPSWPYDARQHCAQSSGQPSHASTIGIVSRQHLRLTERVTMCAEVSQALPRALTPQHILRAPASENCPATTMFGMLLARSGAADLAHVVPSCCRSRRMTTEVALPEPLKSSRLPRSQ